MSRLPPEIEGRILKRLLQGFAYRRIGHEFDVSIATVNRIAQDARKKAPDFDSLRQLSVLLRKVGLSVFDATRACKLVEALNAWGINVDELGDYVMLIKEFLSQRALSEDFIFYAMKLMQLEQACGRTHQEVVEDFEKTRREAAEADERKVTLENESLELTAEIENTKKSLAEFKSQIEKATIARRGVTEIGVGKLAQLVRFIKDFESMGFDVGQVKRLAVWRRELEKLRIDPDGLGKFIAERGPLQAQNNDLRRVNERIEADVNIQAIRKATLLAENSALKAVDPVLRTGTLTMLCKACGYPLPTALPTKESLLDLMRTGQVFSMKCPNCGVQQMFSPWEIALQVAWTILPTDTVTI